MTALGVRGQLRSVGGCVLSLLLLAVGALLGAHALFASVSTKYDRPAGRYELQIGAADRAWVAGGATSHDVDASRVPPLGMTLGAAPPSRRARQCADAKWPPVRYERLVSNYDTHHQSFVMDATSPVVRASRTGALRRPTASVDSQAVAVRDTTSRLSSEAPTTAVDRSARARSPSLGVVSPSLGALVVATQTARNPLRLNVGGESEVRGAINVQHEGALSPGWGASQPEVAGKSLRELAEMGDPYVVASNGRLPFLGGSVDEVLTNNVRIGGAGPPQPAVPAARRNLAGPWASRSLATRWRRAGSTMTRLAELLSLRVPSPTAEQERVGQALERAVRAGPLGWRIPCGPVPPSGLLVVVGLMPAWNSYDRELVLVLERAATEVDNERELIEVFDADSVRSPSDLEA